MKNIFFLLIIFGIFLPPLELNAEEAPKYQGDVRQWEKSMLAYVSNWQNVADRSKKDFEAMRIELDKVTSIYPDRPRLWLILGKIHIHELGLIVNGLKEKGLSNEEGRRNSEYLETIEKINESFRTAIKLNQSDLSLNELDLINTTVTKSDIKVKNYRNMLRLWDQGERFEDNDNTDPVINFEYKTYSKIVTAYVDEKRYEEALAVIDEMSSKFPAMSSEIRAGREQLLNRQKAEREKPLESVKEPPPEAKPNKMSKANAVSKLESSEKPKEAKTNEAYSKEEDSRIFYWFFGVLIMLVVGTVLVRRTK